MSQVPENRTDENPKNSVILRIIYAVIGIGAFGVAICLMRNAAAVLSATPSQSFVGDHAPALIGLPIAASFATALVCGARALESDFRIEFLGLRADGAAAVLLTWVTVFAALVLALRGLW